MPISDRYRIIFIHIPKCAGISVWKGLDIAPCRCNLISVAAIPVYQHMLPKQLKGKYIGEARWNNYKKVTIIRNPYDRIVSDYFWLKPYEQFSRLSFDDFLGLREDVVKNNRYSENMYYDHFYPMYLYFEGIEYDHVLRFENLEAELEELRKIFKIEKQFTKNNQTEHSDFVLTRTQKKRIYNLYKRDFEQFGYKP
jgi:hypothetical protein